MSEFDEIRQQIEEYRRGGTPLRFLVIDDQFSCFELYQNALQGAELVWAETGAEGLYTLRMEKGQFNAVFIDERLPDIHGHEVIAQMKLEWPELLPVLASGFEFDPDVTKALEAIGPVILLSKLYLARDIKVVFNWMNQCRPI